MWLGEGFYVVLTHRALPYFEVNKETIPYSLSQGWSLTQDGILTRRQRVITKQRPQKNDEGAKLPKAQDHCHLG